MSISFSIYLCHKFLMRKVRIPSTCTTMDQLKFCLIPKWWFWSNFWIIVLVYFHFRHGISFTHVYFNVIVPKLRNKPLSMTFSVMFRFDAGTLDHKSCTLLILMASLRYIRRHSASINFPFTFRTLSSRLLCC